MKIRILKKGSRNQLVCIRDNGSTEISGLGPALPFHDIAHFVVEQQLGFQHGFYGNIAAGYTVLQLSDKNVISTLPPESLAAEILTRALQSVYGGAVTAEQYKELVQQEFAQWSLEFAIPGTHSLERMLSRYEELIRQWNSLENGQSLELEWS